MIHNPVRKQLPALSNPGAAGDLRSGKQLVGADGSVVTGALAEVQQAVPTISVSSGGLITASAAQDGGIVAAGSQNATQQLSTQGAATITPGTAAQTAAAAGRYTTGDIKVAGEPNLVPANIAKGVTIFGVAGSYSGAEPVYEIVQNADIQFESTSASLGNYEHHVRITASMNVGRLLGLSVLMTLSDMSTLFFSYPGTSFEDPNPEAVYLLEKGTSLGIWYFDVSGRTIDIYRERRQLWTNSSPPDVMFPAAVYYLPT